MNRMIFLPLVFFLFVLFACTSALKPATRDQVPRISKETLLGMIDDPGLFILDARYGRDWQRASRKIRHADRIETDEIDSWEGRYQTDQRIVLYCA